MKMKKFLNDPNTLTDELLQGYALAASDLIDVEGHLVISKTLKDEIFPRNHCDHGKCISKRYSVTER